jgi:tRNA(Arg) A34 adenosine deaminase TadA
MNYINQARIESEKSACTQKHGVIIVKNGVVVASGHNKKEPSRKKLMLWYGPKRKDCCIHAEYDALYALITGNRHTFRDIAIRRKKYDMYVARNTLENSRPCKDCLELMKWFGIYRVIYTCKNGYVSEKVNEMVTTHISSSRK